MYKRQHGHFDRYREVSNAIMGILRDETPHVQQVSIDEAFLDVTPTAVNREHPVDVARRIQRRVEEPVSYTHLDVYKRQIWDYLKERNPDVYRRIRRSVLNMGTNLPTQLGRRIGITGYRVAQKIFKFN